MYEHASGGNATPSYLQNRKPNPMGPVNGSMTKPVITPKSEGMPGETSPQAPGIMPVQGGVPGEEGMVNPGGGPPITPPGTPPPPAHGPNPQVGMPQPGAAPGDTGLSQLYNYMKGDLENERKQAKSSAVADASKRGVYYGSPLTGSEADIDTQFLKGLGSLQANMYGNEQQSETTRLGMAGNLLNSMPQAQGGDNSALMAMLGQFFARK